MEHIRAFTHSAWPHMSETACGRFAALRSMPENRINCNKSATLKYMI